MLESPGKGNFSNVQYFFGMRYVARNDSLDMGNSFIVWPLHDRTRILALEIDQKRT